MVTYSPSYQTYLHFQFKRLHAALAVSLTYANTKNTIQYNRCWLTCLIKEYSQPWILELNIIIKSTHTETHSYMHMYVLGGLGRNVAEVHNRHN